MPRPKRPRYIQSHPGIQGFTPDGVMQNGESILSIEEFEAIRLSDYLGLDQSQAAEQMNVSRQTFGRILKKARYNLSEALVTGKRLRVTGGCYKTRPRGRGKSGAHNIINENQEDIIMRQDQRTGTGQGAGLAAGKNRSCGQGQGRGGRGNCRGQNQGRCQNGNQGGKRVNR